MPDSSPSTSNAANLAAAVSHAKIPGTLHLSAHMLNWSPTSSSLASKNIGIPLQHIDRLLASVPKPESTTFSLKLVFYQSDDPEQRFFVNGKGDVLFTFTAPEGRERALADREAFKERLAQVAQKNKNEREEDAEASTSAGPSRGGSAAPAVRRSASTVNGQSAAAASPAPAKQEMSAEDKAKRREQELQLRISILQSHPDLKALHADLVIKGQIRDAEFWSHPTRAALLRSERAVMQQRQGRNAMIADPKPSNDGDGNLKINLSAHMVRDMFEQYPVVAKAYDELVPKQMDEQGFWSRYFQSKLYHRLRTSARSAASEHIVRADPVFDKYLDDLVEDDDLESRREYHAHDSFLDLAATEVDHQETGNQKDFTMRAGGERSALPLLRRFNQHSSSLLDSALGTQEQGQRRVVGGVGEEYEMFSKSKDGTMNGTSSLNGPSSGPSTEATRRTHEHYDQIVIEELQAERRSRAVPLDVAPDKQGFFEGREAANSLDGGERQFDAQRARDVLLSVKGELLDWSDSASDMLGSYNPNRKESDRAMKMMLERIRQTEEARNDESKANDLSENVQRQLISCQAATTEFLRQFWAAVAPQPPPPPPPPSSNGIKNEAEEEQKPLTPAQRRTRAKRMLALLRNSGERGDNVAKLAEEEVPGRGAKRVKLALEPTEKAVARAIRIGDTMFPAGSAP